MREKCNADKSLVDRFNHFVTERGAGNLACSNAFQAEVAAALTPFFPTNLPGISSHRSESENTRASTCGILAFSVN